MGSLTDKFQIAPETQVGFVRLSVSDLGRSLDFYGELLGFRTAQRSAGLASLSASGELPLQLILEEIPAARPAPRGTTGLFHTAVRLPDRGQLGRIASRLIRSGWPLQGFSDHKVSEAIYLADPDGLGVELYADRPRQTWPRLGGRVNMTTDPLDLEGLLQQASDLDQPWDGIHPQTDNGHIHLRVSDLSRSGQFYHQALGLDITQENYPGALFLSAGGYHHHIGLNIWGSRGGQPPPPDSVGLKEFSLTLPNEESLRILLAHLENRYLPPGSGPTTGDRDEVRLQDPDGVRVALTIR